MKKSFSKIFISFVAIIYVLSTVGVSVFSHYCGGELEKVTLFSKTISCCDNDEDSVIEDDDCCKDEIAYVSFQKDFTFYTIAKIIKAPVLALSFFNFQHSIYKINHITKSLITAFVEFPPPKLIQSSIVSCSILRI